MTKDRSTPPWAPLLATVLNWRSGAGPDASKQQAAQWRKIRASLRRGASESTEHYAYPYVLPKAPFDSRLLKTTAVRLCALVAEHDKIPVFQATEKTRYRSLGQWCNLVSHGLAGDGVSLDPAKPDSVASRLAYIHTQTAPEAITTIRRIMDVAAKLDTVPALDFYDLFATFFYWGNGFSAESVARRRRILQDYYSGFAAQKSSDTTSVIS
ncbi:MAG: type I-E CRISPR-associated protein Cse2/CasB [Corynebacterium sp.]|nr:type I-E CRISPR-associated protein Cse2/CasB [Corynebacterium sp.]